MVAFIKSVTFDCDDVRAVAEFWAAVLGSNVDEDSTTERALAEPAGWGGPTLWFQWRRCLSRHDDQIHAIRDQHGGIEVLLDAGSGCITSVGLLAFSLSRERLTAGWL